MLDLDPFLQTPVRQLSLGQRMRGELTASMLHDPELLFLDEPTIGLDVVAKQRVRDFLVEINRERGVTVLLTTHDLGDIERLCKRLLVIDQGSLIWDGRIDDLKERYGAERTLIVDLEEPAPPLQIEGARVEKVDGPRQWLRFRGPAADLTARVASAARLVDLQITEPDIEEIVRRIYGAKSKLMNLVRFANQVQLFSPNLIRCQPNQIREVHIELRALRRRPGRASARSRAASPRTGRAGTSRRDRRARGTRGRSDGSRRPAGSRTRAAAAGRAARPPRAPSSGSRSAA